MQFDVKNLKCFGGRNIPTALLGDSAPVFRVARWLASKLNWEGLRLSSVYNPDVTPYVIWYAYMAVPALRSQSPSWLRFTIHSAMRRTIQDVSDDDVEV